MNKPWVDLGSDVNWREYGGLWGRAIDETDWEVVEFFGSDESAHLESGAKYWAKYTTHSLKNPDLPSALQCQGCDTDDYSDADKIAALARYTSSWAETYFYRGNNAHKVLAAAKAGVLLSVEGVTVSSSMQVIR